MQNDTTTGKPFYAGIEAGGTKFICAVGTGPDDLADLTEFPTTTADETLDRTKSFLQKHGGSKAISAIGIGSFGPIDLNPASPTYGYITSTPKPGWANTDFVGALRREVDVPIAFDTDVNTAVLGEHHWGAAQGLDTVVYLTIGTGIGGGILAGGKLLHGAMHPEVGHIRIPHDMAADPYAGSCPFHGDCLEGLACGPAMQKRWGQRAETLPEGHPAWALEARYLALALVNLIFIVSPQRIVMGGGIMKQTHLFPLVRREVSELINGYVTLPSSLEAFIVPPALEGRSGVLGAIALAQM